MKLNECNFNNNVEIFTDSDYSFDLSGKPWMGFSVRKTRIF
jgi:hypothetical protein